jgi:hypothetical protein
LVVALYIHVMGPLILSLFSRNIVSKVLRDLIRARLRLLDFEKLKLH